MQEVVLQCMDNAVWFDQENNKVHLKYQLSIRSVDGIELQTILKVMDVSLNYASLFSLYLTGLSDILIFLVN